MYPWLVNYDVFPRIVPEGKTVSITVKPLGRHTAFDPNAEYHFAVQPMLYRNSVLVSDCEANHSCSASYTDGNLVFTDTFYEEQEHRLFLYCGEQLIERFHIYSLKEDLFTRMPLLGDLHLHSTYSDGRQAPEIVAAECRRRGYDFIALTDHHNYAGSLSARSAYRDVPIDLNIVPGEEVHLPGNDVHIVNFGGTHSVNFQVENNLQYLRPYGICPENDPQEEWCALPGDAMPKTLTEEAFRAEVNALAEQIQVPDGVEAFPYLCCQWVCRKIREADGLSIFAHPYWIKDHAYHIPLLMTDALMEHCPFDCFEVLGGEKYLNQNEFQTWHYVQQLENGNHLHVVGCSDSHNQYAGKDSAYAATVVFAESNDRKPLITAVQDGYSVAIDMISAEKRLVGDIRLLRYTRYLLDAFFPAMEELCAEEGRLMKAYVCGTDPDAKKKLAMLSGQTIRLRNHIFAKRAE